MVKTSAKNIGLCDPFFQKQKKKGNCKIYNCARVKRERKKDLLTEILNFSRLRSDARDISPKQYQFFSEKMGENYTEVENL